MKQAVEFINPEPVFQFPGQLISHTVSHIASHLSREKATIRALGMEAREEGIQNMLHIKGLCLLLTQEMKEVQGMEMGGNHQIHRK